MKILYALPIAAAIMAPASAQLTDPTQPPQEVLDAAAGRVVSQTPPPSGPTLQSVLISPHRKVAIIDGEMVRVGQTYKGAVLASVSETEAVLTRGGQRTVLRLFPAADTPAGAGQRKKK